MPPSILKDGNRFFPNVLNDKVFQKKGVLTRTEGRISWGVIDPRRHVMTIWQKDRSDFVEAAKARNASLITNGPFYLYSGGSKAWATFKYGVDLFFTGIGLAEAPEEEVAKERRRLYKKYFTGEKVEGFIFGRSELIDRHEESRPRASYFGRVKGRKFSEYKIGHGDPVKMDEVIGGLFRSVLGYKAVDNGTASQVGTWGLAPLLTAPTSQLKILQESGLDEASKEYEQAILEGGSDMVPVGKEADKNLAGLVIALFGGGSPNGFARILSKVLVKDAVRVDGNSSILLAQGHNVLQGQYMNGPKRTYNTHGYMFKPG